MIWRMAKAICPAALGFSLVYYETEDSKLKELCSIFAEHPEFVLGFVAGVIAKQIKSSKIYDTIRSETNEPEYAIGFISGIVARQIFKSAELEVI